MEVKKVLSTDLIESVMEPQTNIKSEKKPDDPIIKNNEEFQPVVIQHNNTKQSSLREKILETKNKQGLFGKLWDGFKNLTGIGAGSDKALQAVEKLEKGQLSEQEALEAIEKYKEGQKQSVDIIADIASGIISFATFSAAVGLGLAAAPFTAGASLGLVAIGVGLAGVTGSLSKSAIKKTEAMVGGNKYDSFGYDMTTGFVNGIFAPITAGIGGAVGKTVAQRVGVSAIRQGGEIVLADSIKSTTKGTITRTLLNTSISYKGGSLLARTAALGSDMAANGAVTGAADSSVRYLAGDAKNKSLNGLLSEVTTGTIGGLIAAPVIGGGMRLAGNGVGKLTGKVEDFKTEIVTNAKLDMQNKGVIESKDPLKIKALIDLALDRKSLFAADDELNAIIDQSRKLNITFAEERAHLDKMSGITNRALGKSTALNAIITPEEKFQQLHQVELLDKQLHIFTIRTKKTIKELKSRLNPFNEEGLTAHTSQLEEKADRLYKIRRELSALKNKARKKATAGASYPDNTPDHIEPMDNIINYNKKLHEAENLASEIQVDLKVWQTKSGLKRFRDIVEARDAKREVSEIFKNATPEQQNQMRVSDTNIFLEKFAQTFAGDDSLSPTTKVFFEGFQSGCVPSRTLSQAQILSNELYGNGKYTLIKSFGAGTIGETYLAKTTTGTEVVIKMIKNGVNLEKFTQDKDVLLQIIAENAESEAKKKYLTEYINNLFASWSKELDFGLEAKGATAMAKEGKRFKVARIIEVGVKEGNNISLVMEKAPGYPLDKLLKMMKLYNESPSAFMTKYADDIAQTPWLKDVPNWSKKLPRAYQAAQNEQMMFVIKNKSKTIHADPHAGNVFADMGDDGKIMITYIDAGNTLQKNAQESLSDLSMIMKALIGDAKGATKILLEGATFTNGKSKEEVVQSIAEELDRRVFRARVNLNDNRFVNGTIDDILKSNGVVAKPENANSLKATLQFTQTQTDLSTAAGVYLPKVDIKDLLIGIKKSFFVQPSDTVTALKEIFVYIKQNPKEALRTLAQVFIDV